MHHTKFQRRVSNCSVALAASCSSVVFYLFLVFLEIGVNGVQTLQNFLTIFFSTRQALEALRGGQTRSKKMARQLGTHWCLVGPTWFCLTSLHLHKFSKIMKPTEESTKYFFCRRKFQNQKIPSGGLFWHSARGGFDHRGGPSSSLLPFDDVWVVYHGPTGP